MPFLVTTSTNRQSRKCLWLTTTLGLIISTGIILLRYQLCESVTLRMGLGALYWCGQMAQLDTISLFLFFFNTLYIRYPTVFHQTQFIPCNFFFFFFIYIILNYFYRKKIVRNFLFFSTFIIITGLVSHECLHAK